MDSRRLIDAHDPEYEAARDAIKAAGILPGLDGYDVQELGDEAETRDWSWKLTVDRYGEGNHVEMTKTLPSGVVQRVRRVAARPGVALILALAEAVRLDGATGPNADAGSKSGSDD